MTENTDVVVIGGGYAGVMAANRLTQRDDLTVILINPRHPVSLVSCVNTTTRRATRRISRRPAIGSCQ
jgi:choline dehydrogenase-like flavoprotein